MTAADGTPLVVSWTGKATLRDAPTELGPWIAAVVAEAQARGSVELRFEKLRHANSSSILAVVQLARKLLEKGVAVAIHYDPGQRWQRFTFDGLGELDPGGRLLRISGGA